MNKRISRGGGKSFLEWWKNPKNRKKVYESDKADAEYLREQEKSERNKSKSITKRHQQK